MKWFYNLFLGLEFVNGMYKCKIINCWIGKIFIFFGD